MSRTSQPLSHLLQLFIIYFSIRVFDEFEVPGIFSFFLNRYSMYVPMYESADYTLTDSRLTINTFLWLPSVPINIL
jgi:hypothetical protein